MLTFPLIYAILLVFHVENSLELFVYMSFGFNYVAIQRLKKITLNFCTSLAWEYRFLATLVILNSGFSQMDSNSCLENWHTVYRPKSQWLKTRAGIMASPPPWQPSQKYLPR